MPYCTTHFILCKPTCEIKLHKYRRDFCQMFF
nr:MAG TPA: hypothetical protein [Caudoviricetes sp.]